MRQTTKQTKTHQAPTIKVVEFMIELGYGLYGEKNQSNLIPDFETDAPVPNNDQYIQSNNWNSTFSEM